MGKLTWTKDDFMVEVRLGSPGAGAPLRAVVPPPRVTETPMVEKGEITKTVCRVPSSRYKSYEAVGEKPSF